MIQGPVPSPKSSPNWSGAAPVLEKEIAVREELIQRASAEVDNPAVRWSLKRRIFGVLEMWWIYILGFGLLKRMNDCCENRVERGRQREGKSFKT